MVPIHQITPEETEEVISMLILEAKYRMPVHIMRSFIEKGKVISLSRNMAMIDAGEFNPDIYVVKSGVVRGTYLDGNIEKTAGFAPPGTMLMSFHSFYAIAWYDAGSTNRKGQQTGTIDVVFATDGKVYLKQPISKLETDAWIVGTLDAAGTTLTVQLDQCLGTDADGSDYAIIKILEFDEDYEEFSVYNKIHQITYTIAPDRSKITLNGTSADYILGAIWTSTNEWTGYGDYASVYTPAIKNELVTPPASLTTEDYVLTAQSYMDETEVSYNVSVGFDGNDMYIKGIFNEFSDKWVKGSKDGNTYKFATGQYLGQQYTKDYYMVSTSLSDTKTLQPFTLTASSDGEGYENNTQYLIISGLRSGVYLTEALSKISIKKAPKDGVSFTVPYDEQFKSASSLSNYTIVNGNKDSYTWYYNSLKSSVDYDSMMARNGSDDWLITPAIVLEEGVKYNYTVYARSYTASWAERIEACVGESNTAEAMTQMIIEPTDVATGDYSPFTGSFTPAASGKYYFGLHAITQTDQMTLSVNRILVTAAESGISDITTEDESAVEEYFTLQGVKVDIKSVDAGIYICRKGSKSRKVFVQR